MIEATTRTAAQAIDRMTAEDWSQLGPYLSAAITARKERTYAGDSH